MKYYAYKYQDGSTLITDKWDPSNSNGKKGVQFKSFSSRNEAEAFLGTLALPKDSPKVCNVTSKERTIIYTDGSCFTEAGEKRAGGGVYFPQSGKEVMVAVKRPFTNQRAELSALIEALQHLFDFYDPSAIIYSDSMYAINCVSVWCFGWKNEGWWPKNQDEANKLHERNEVRIDNLDLIFKGVTLKDKLKNVELRWVKGHSGVAGNERADRIAEAAARLYY